MKAKSKLRPSFVVDPSEVLVKPGHLKVLHAKLTPRTISDLISACLDENELPQKADGKGSRRILTLLQVILVAFGRRLRTYGLSPIRIRHACDKVLEKWTEIFPKTFRFSEETIDSDGNVVSRLEIEGEPVWLVMDPEAWGADFYEYAEVEGYFHVEPVSESDLQKNIGKYRGGMNLIVEMHTLARTVVEPLRDVIQG